MVKPARARGIVVAHDTTSTPRDRGLNKRPILMPRSRSEVCTSSVRRIQQGDLYIISLESHSSTIIACKGIRVKERIGG
jgi:hypothetical protein